MPDDIIQRQIREIVQANEEIFCTDEEWAEPRALASHMGVFWLCKEHPSENQFA
jgi:hypothetical protein